MQNTFTVKDYIFVFAEQKIMSTTTQTPALRFIAESSCGKIAKHLRMIGLDCTFDKTYSTHYVMFLAQLHDCIIVSQSVAMTKLVEKANKKLQQQQQEEEFDDDEEEEDDQQVSHEQAAEMKNAATSVKLYKYYAVDPCKKFGEQILALLTHFQITCKREHLFTRCLQCNCAVVQYKWEALTEQEQVTLRTEMGEAAYANGYYKNDLTRCNLCGKLFWKV